MTLSVKMLKIDEDFDKKGAKQVLVGSSDIPPGNSTKKTQNLRKIFFFIFSPPAIPTPTPIDVREHFCQGRQRQI